MTRIYELGVLPVTTLFLRALACLERPLFAMAHDTDEIAARRKRRTERTEDDVLWCWKQRGFW
ncbi:hypothetical protein DUT91_00975 [Phyllobacterium salinisoli]|uniref:Uncharacterized protein n=1 Tax=Phyllobacterium salinisoli TaxID=1899321 RepID=A0A368KA81_9HYPH|nr:hypothetical protein [Phyllobacterium salinisoli]RCS25413.1 hypothetical protein DUT91_00975 [Phyllobacterium salinisoli]